MAKILAVIALPLVAGILGSLVDGRHGEWHQFGESRSAFEVTTGGEEELMEHGELPLMVEFSRFMNQRAPAILREFSDWKEAKLLKKEKTSAVAAEKQDSCHYLHACTLDSNNEVESCVLHVNSNEGGCTLDFNVEYECDMDGAASGMAAGCLSSSYTHADDLFVYLRVQYYVTPRPKITYYLSECTMLKTSIDCGGQPTCQVHLIDCRTSLQSSSPAPSTMPPGPTESVTDPTDMVTDQTDMVTDPTDMVTDPTDMVTDPTDMVTDPTDMVTDTTDMVTDPTGMVTDTTKMVTDATEMVTGPTMVWATTKGSKPRKTTANWKTPYTTNWKTPYTTNWKTPYPTKRPSIINMLVNAFQQGLVGVGDAIEESVSASNWEQLCPVLWYPIHPHHCHRARCAACGPAITTASSVCTKAGEKSIKGCITTVMGEGICNSCVNSYIQK